MGCTLGLQVQINITLVFICVLFDWEQKKRKKSISYIAPAGAVPRQLENGWI
jgi:hypothetical protein